MGRLGESMLVVESSRLTCRTLGQRFRRGPPRELSPWIFTPGRSIQLPRSENPHADCRASAWACASAQFSAEVGCTCHGRVESRLRAPMVTATARLCTISEHPCRACAGPSTRSVAASTTSFMYAACSRRPAMTFFIGRKSARTPRRGVLLQRPLFAESDLCQRRLREYGAGNQFMIDGTRRAAELRVDERTPFGTSPPA